MIKQLNSHLRGFPERYSNAIKGEDMVFKTLELDSSLSADMALKLLTKFGGTKRNTLRCILVSFLSSVSTENVLCLIAPLGTKIQITVILSFQVPTSNTSLWIGFVF